MWGLAGSFPEAVVAESATENLPVVEGPEFNVLKAYTLNLKARNTLGGIMRR